MIDDNAKAKVARVIGYAMDYPFFPGKSPTPGDDPNFVVHLDTYRCVFTFSHVEGKVYRHLTISIPRTKFYPNAVAAFHIAELFGFTGYDKSQPSKPPEGWMMDVKRDENYLMLVQEV